MTLLFNTKRVKLARMASRKSLPILTFIFVLLMLGLLPVRGQEVTPEATELPLLPLPSEGQLYAPMTFPVAVDPGSYTNPFSSDDIEVLGVFKSPSGKQLVIPGFWM